MSTPAKGRAGGVLPINVAATKKATKSNKSASRGPAVRLRLIIRRLPPGLTEPEFWEGLGSEWQVGNGKVDWFAFKPGKISKDLSKPSRPGRAYFKVKDQSVLDPLSTKVKQAQFKDAKNTASDPCLIGPPSLEFAPYNKAPGGRVRNDGRQGTIDQDPEFFEFLQSLTEPISKPAPSESEAAENTAEKVIITPLVQFIKEKKANKAKDKEAATAAKSTKKQESKDAKETKETKSKSEPKATVIVKSNASTAEKARVAKATQDAVKAINKSVASMQTKPSTAKSETKPKEATAAVATSGTVAPNPVAVQTSAQTPTPKRERERGNASAAARMISRDLGLTPKEPRTPRAARNAGTAAPATATTTTTIAAAPTMVPINAAKTEIPPAAATPASTTKTSASAPATSTATSAPHTGPRNDRVTPPQPKQTNSGTPRQTKSVPQPSSGSKSAFLKHANPSQGITEDLLRTTFAVYGEISRCEIDKKKGLGYIDFVDSESLKKAMAASPVKIGSGQVVILENKSPYRKGAAQQKGNDKAAAGSQTPSVASTATLAAASPRGTPAVPAASSAATAPTTNSTSSGTANATNEAGSAAQPNAAASAQVQGSATPTAARSAKGGGKGNRGGGPPSTPGQGGSNNRNNRNSGRSGRGVRAAKGNTNSTSGGGDAVASAPVAAPAAALTGAIITGTAPAPAAPADK